MSSVSTVSDSMSVTADFPINFSSDAADAEPQHNATDQTSDPDYAPVYDADAIIFAVQNSHLISPNFFLQQDVQSPDSSGVIPPLELPQHYQPTPRRDSTQRPRSTSKTPRSAASPGKSVSPSKGRLDRSAEFDYQYEEKEKTPKRNTNNEEIEATPRVLTTSRSFTSSRSDSIAATSVATIRIRVPGRARRKSAAFGSAPRFAIYSQVNASPGPAHEHAPVLSSVVDPHKLGISIRSKLINPKENLTPSPGPVYDLPSTIGPTVAPAFSIGTLPIPTSTQDTPAPNQYTIPSSLSSEAHSIGSILPSDVDWKMKQAAFLPGPGDQDLPSSLDPHGRSISLPLPEPRRDHVPGPKYDLPSYMGEGPAYTFGAHHFECLPDYPGPGTYSPELLDSSPSPSIGLPLGPLSSFHTPGPKYDLPNSLSTESHSIGARLPSDVDLMIRHAPQAAVGMYEVGKYKAIGGPESQKVSIATHVLPPKLQSTPAGADYSPQSLDAAPAYSIMPPRPIEYVTPGPGPAAHSAEAMDQFNALHAAPAHSISLPMPEATPADGPSPADYSQEAQDAFNALHRGPAWTIGQKTPSALDRELLVKAQFPGPAHYYQEKLPSAFDAAQPYEENYETIEIPLSAVSVPTSSISKLSPRAIQILRESAARMAFLARTGTKPPANERPDSPNKQIME